jgi:hypothetical protein
MTAVSLIIHSFHQHQRFSWAESQSMENDLLRLACKPSTHVTVLRLKSIIQSIPKAFLFPSTIGEPCWQNDASKNCCSIHFHFRYFGVKSAHHE